MLENDKSTSVSFDSNQIYKLSKRDSAGRIITKFINLGAPPFLHKVMFNEPWLSV